MLSLSLSSDRLDVLELCLVTISDLIWPKYLALTLGTTFAGNWNQENAVFNL